MTTPNSNGKQVEKRRLYIVTPNEEIVLEMPATWKVTFGPFNPGSPQRDQPDNGASLRIYEAKDKQRACFTNVISFRDLSMPVWKRERAINVDGKAVKMSFFDSGNPNPMERVDVRKEDALGHKLSEGSIDEIKENLEIMGLDTQEGSPF